MTNDILVILIRFRYVIVVRRMAAARSIVVWVLPARAQLNLRQKGRLSIDMPDDYSPCGGINMKMMSEKDLKTCCRNGCWVKFQVYL